MPFPFVAVTLPDDTPPAYVAGLLSACSQAYPEGNCRTDPDSSPPTATSDKPKPDVDADGGAPNGDTPSGARKDTDKSVGREPEILANITWLNETTATVLLGLPHWRNHRWIERSVPFKEQDQPLERYRALGFTVGSLAVTVAEVARLEQEARDPEPGPVQSPVEKPEKPNPAPVPTRALTVDDPPDAIDIPLVPEPSEPTHVFVRGYLAGELGEGFDTIRRGGSAGIGLFGDHFGGHVSGYYTDASGNGLDATFSGVELTADIRIAWSVLEANICVGGGYGHLSARVNKETSQVFPSGVVAVNVMPTRWILAPYLGVGVRVFRGFATDVPELDPLGPLTPFLQLGLVLSSQPGADRETKR